VINFIEAKPKIKLARRYCIFFLIFIDIFDLKNVNYKTENQCFKKYRSALSNLITIISCGACVSFAYTKLFCTFQIHRKFL